MKARKYWGSEQWKAWILEQADSGMRIKDWCETHGVDQSLFFRWRRRLQDKGELDLSTGSVCPAAGNPSNSPVVVQMSFKDLETGPDHQIQGAAHIASLAESILASQIVIEAPSSGCRIFVGTEFSQDTLRKVMEVLN